mmetsp:Transcript_3151/g.10449  ORF Transcript_3151/g.10449 Transcript_3151/m.10449 type:complete len:236 (+) Transcript_3151:326-1033(+)
MAIEDDGGRGAAEVGWEMGLGDLEMVDGDEADHGEVVVRVVRDEGQLSLDGARDVVEAVLLRGGGELGDDVGVEERRVLRQGSDDPVPRADHDVRRGRRVGLRAAAPSSNVVRQQRCASRRHLTPPHRTYVARSPPRPPPPPPPPARSGPGNAASSATGQFNKEAAHFSGDTTHVLADARADKRTDRRVGRRRPDGLENLELLLQHPDERPHHTRHFGKEDAKEAQKVSSSWGRV